MLVLMISLTLALFILGLLAKDKAVILFCSLTVIANVGGYFIPDGLGLLYYLGDSVSNMLIVLLISKLTTTSKLAVKLQLVSLLVILANCIGWVMYRNYLDPDSYNLLCIAIYFYIAIVIINTGGFKRVRDITVGSWRSWFYSGYTTSCINVQRDKKESRT